MITSNFFSTVLLIIIGFALVIGFMYEPMVARWEQKQKRKVLRALKKMREFRK